MPLPDLPAPTTTVETFLHAVVARLDRLIELAEGQDRTEATGPARERQPAPASPAKASTSKPSKTAAAQRPARKRT